MKRIIALIMVMIMGMSLCACAGDVKSDVPGNVVNEVGADKNVETLPHTEEPTETPAETSTEAPAAAGADLSDVLLSVSIDSYSKDQLQGSETIDVEYDAQGNQTVAVEVVHETSGRVTYLTDIKYDYDEAGRVISSHDRQYIDRYFSYDENGRLTRVEYTGSLYEECHVEYVYDEAGNLISLWEGEENGVYYEDGVQKQGRACHQEYLYTYADGKLVHMEHNKNGFTVTEDYKYDASGRLETTTQTDQYGFETWINYSYDDAGNVIKAEYSTLSRGEVVVDRTDEYTYDDQGRVLTFTVCAGQYAKHVITYQYGAY